MSGAARGEQQQRVAAELAELVRLHGADRLSGGPAVRALLNDRLGADAPAHAREVRVIADAVTEGLVDRLPTQEPDEAAEWFADETGYDVDVAKWAVAAWVGADGRPPALPEVREQILVMAPHRLATGSGSSGPADEHRGPVSEETVHHEGGTTEHRTDAGAGGRDRKRWLVAGGVAAAVALVGGVALATSGGGDERSESAAADLTSAELELIDLVPDLGDCEPRRDELRSAFTMVAADGEIETADIDEPLAMVRCSVEGAPDFADAWLFENAGGLSAFYAASSALDEETGRRDGDGDDDDVEYFAYDSAADESATLVESRVFDADIVIAYSVERGRSDELLEWYDVDATDTEPEVPFDPTEVVRDPDRVLPAPGGAGYEIGDCASGTGSVTVDLTPTPCGSSSANLRVVAVVFRVGTCPDDAVVELTSTIVVDGVGRGAFYCFGEI